MMRQNLVLTDETARHRFLADLPPHVRGQQASAPATKRRRLAPAISAKDVREFLMAYCACFVAAAAFLF